MTDKETLILSLDLLTLKNRHVDIEAWTHKP